MIPSPDYIADDSCQPQFSNPPIQVAEDRGAPLLNWAGLALIRQLLTRLGVAPALDAAVRVLRRCKWYSESDHIITLIYNMLSGGSKLSDINRLREDAGLRRLLGTERIPHATTAGDFLARFAGKRENHEKRDEKSGKVALRELREVLAEVQQRAFGLLSRARRKVATIDCDSSIHEVYGEKKEGADYSYDKRWSYSARYVTLAETGDVLDLRLREGCRYTSTGTTEVLPGVIERVGRYFGKLRMRGDSGFYDQEIVRICDAREVEFFIVAEQRENLMKKVHEIRESAWKPFERKQKETGGGGRRRRRKRENVKRKIKLKRNPKTTFKGKPELAEMTFRPASWKQAYRFVIKRTPIIDRDDKQLYLANGMKKYAYWIVVTNSRRGATEVLRIAQGRGNQENLIKDLKQGLGLAHVPTGFLGANQAYFMIAALAWNLKTWMLNLLQLGDGAVQRCKRFLYRWMVQAAVVAKTGRNTVVLKLPAGEYFQRFSTALARIAAL